MHKTWAILAILLFTIPARSAERPPNVVMIISDDQAWTDFGFMGHKVIKTPHIDKLAAESATFPNGYVPTSLCRASLATLLTGLYGHQHKICCNDPPDGEDRTKMHPFIKNAHALPRLLRKKGYVSLQTGKFWEGHYSNAGFTAGETTDKDRHIARRTPQIGRTGLKPIYDFIEKSGDKPFFVWYAPMMPHTPHTPPARLLKKYAVDGRNLKVAKYWAMCEWFDETCGELLGYLDKNKLADNTIVLFVVDNGWIQEPGNVRTTRGWFAPKSKLSPYDGGLRTPVMVCWPGKTKAGTYADLVSTIDLVPTILNACGLEPTKEMPGVSLLERAKGGKPLERDAVFGEIFVHTAVDINKPALNLTHRWVRQGDWKLIDFTTKGKLELYNLKDDPLEEKNLAAENKELTVRLRARIDKWWSAKRR